MPIAKSEKIWLDGKFINWDDAKIHILSHVIHYGSSVFEGLRCYETKKGPACFRLGEHMERLLNSAKIYRMEINYSLDKLVESVTETIKINKLKSCYVRPIAFRGYGEMGINPLNNPVNFCIAVWEWGKYLGSDGLENGISVKVSTWFRMAPNTLPALAKAGANYMNSQLIKMEALLDGYAEGIGLDTNGFVSEGSGENIFVIKSGIIYTPPVYASVLPGITRDSVLKLAEGQSIPVKEQLIPREMLYIADEVFLTGSAAEITPVKQIDKIKIGNGSKGAITKILQDEFFAITSGEKEDKYNWLTYVY